MPTTTSSQQEKANKIAIIEDWTKTSAKILKEMAPLAKHVPALGPVAGTVSQVLDLWDVSLLFLFFFISCRH